MIIFLSFGDCFILHICNRMHVCLSSRIDGHSAEMINEINVINIISISHIAVVGSCPSKWSSSC
jgi:hypothetical protein